MITRRMSQTNTNAKNRGASPAGCNSSTIPSGVSAATTVSSTASTAVCVDQALTTIVSANLSCTHWRGWPKMSNASTSPYTEPTTVMPTISGTYTMTTSTRPSTIAAPSRVPRPASSCCSGSMTSCTAACGGAYGFVVFISSRPSHCCVPRGAFYAFSRVLSLGGRQSCAVHPGAGGPGEQDPDQGQRKADGLDRGERLMEQQIRLDRCQRGRKQQEGSDLGRLPVTHHPHEQSRSYHGGYQDRPDERSPQDGRVIPLDGTYKHDSECGCQCSSNILHTGRAAQVYPRQPFLEQRSGGNGNNTEEGTERAECGNGSSPGSSQLRSQNTPHARKSDQQSGPGCGTELSPGCAD